MAYTQNRLSDLHSALLKDSLATGDIITVNGKHNLIQRVHGHIVKSLPSVAPRLSVATHFTPNAFLRLRTNKEGYVWGHSDDNLAAINAFVFDIDTKQYSAQEIAMHCIDASIGAPSYVVATPRGVQFGFILSESIYINKTRRSLKMARHIHKNLLNSLRDLDVDIACNPFGFYRVPTVENTLLLTDTLYTPNACMQWSLSVSDDAATAPALVVHRGGKAAHVTTSWYTKLLGATHVKGTKGMLGRNNVLFTLALACYQDGKDIQQAQQQLSDWNTRLQSPLKQSDVLRAIGSAYSGKYHGPSAEYVYEIMDNYFAGEEFHYTPATKYFYKHKKERNDRVRSHLNEWEQDIRAYVENNIGATGYLVATQTQLMAALNIPSSSLNAVLNQSKILIRKTNGKTGRGARTMLTTVKAMMHHIFTTVSVSKANYVHQLQQLLEGCDHNPAYYNLIDTLIKLNYITAHWSAPPPIPIGFFSTA